MSFSKLTSEQRLDMAMRGVAARNAQRKASGSNSERPIPPFCKRGHEMDEKNAKITYYKNGRNAGKRVIACRACIRGYERVYRQRKSRAKRDAIR